MSKFKKSSTAGKTPQKIVSKPKLKTMINPFIKAPLSREQIEESIRLKAYELYLMRLGQNGNALTDWLNAEKTVLQA